MTTLLMKRGSILTCFKVAFINLLRFFASLIQALWQADQPEEEQRPEATVSKPSTRSLRYIVRHSFKAKSKRKKRTRGLSYVSAAILEDYGSILPRRERRLLMKSGIAFTHYYN